MYEYYIFQLPTRNEKCFRHVDYDKVDLGEYVYVYDFKSETEKNLEDIFEMLNINHPKDYHARSLSVSDVIFIKHDNKREVYVVDSFGFKKVELDETRKKVM